MTVWERAREHPTSACAWLTDQRFGERVTNRYSSDPNGPRTLRKLSLADRRRAKRRAEAKSATARSAIVEGSGMVHHS